MKSATNNTTKRPQPEDEEPMVSIVHEIPLDTIDQYLQEMRFCHDALAFLINVQMDQDFWELRGDVPGDQILMGLSQSALLVHLQAIHERTERMALRTDRKARQPDLSVVKPDRRKARKPIKTRKVA